MMKIVDMLVLSGMAKSKSEAKRLIQQGAVTVYAPEGYKLLVLENEICEIKIEELEKLKVEGEKNE